MTQNPSESESKKTSQAYDLADLGIGTSDAGTAHSDTEYSLEDFLPILVNLLMPRRHLTAAPTFTPNEPACESCKGRWLHRFDPSSKR
jgi:hypothetical protein